MATGQSFNAAAATPILKHRYTTKKIETLSLQSPAVADMEKDPESGGDYFIGALRSGIPSSRSASDTVAFTLGNASTYSQWQCPWFDDYGAANITGGAIARAKGDANALVKAMTGEFDGIFDAMGQSLGTAMWGDGGGSIGQIASFTNSGASPCVITLTDPNTSINFWIGQQFQTSVDDGTAAGGVDSAITLGTVNSVDIANGLIGVSFTGSGPLVASHYVFMNGDYGAKFFGIPAWILTPAASAAMTSAAFNGINRTVDKTRMSGLNYDGVGSSKLGTVITLATQINRLRGRPDRLDVNHTDFADLLKEGQGRVLNTTIKGGSDMTISFDAVNLMTPGGQVTITPDAFVPAGYFWLRERGTWLLPSMEEVPHVIGAGIDDQEWLRVTGSDTFQLRVVYRCTTYCSAPWKNGAGKF